MLPPSRNPIYNLSAVLKETGLRADVLRAWERRYALPKPERTPGGHRLYSDYDVATIKWLRARQHEGLSIRRAADLWKEIIDNGRDPFSEYPTAGQVERNTFPAETAPMDELRGQWLEACLAFDTIRAEEIIHQALATASVEKVCFELLQRGISQIGDFWRQGKASVQQEHFATALVIRRIDTLISLMPNPTRSGTLLMGCPAGELHSFPMLLLMLMLRRKGWNVTYLGANIPLEQIIQAAETIRPDLIILAAQRLETAAGLRVAAELFQRDGLALAYGGHIFNATPEIRALIPAYFLGETLEESIGRIEQLASAPAPFPEIIRVARNFQETAAIFRFKRPRIEARVIEKLKKLDLANEAILLANEQFAEGLLAALGLGDPAFMANDLEWVRDLLVDRKIAGETLRHYLDAYRKVVDEEMGSAGVCIRDWIDSYLDTD